MITLCHTTGQKKKANSLPAVWGFIFSLMLPKNVIFNLILSFFLHPPISGHVSIWLRFFRRRACSSFIRKEKDIGLCWAPLRCALLSLSATINEIHQRGWARQINPIRFCHSGCPFSDILSSPFLMLSPLFLNGCHFHYISFFLYIPCHSPSIAIVYHFKWKNCVWFNKQMCPSATSPRGVLKKSSLLCIFVWKAAQNPTEWHGNRIRCARRHTSETKAFPSAAFLTRLPCPGPRSEVWQPVSTSQVVDALRDAGHAHKRHLSASDACDSAATCSSYIQVGPWHRLEEQEQACKCTRETD